MGTETTLKQKSLTSLWLFFTFNSAVFIALFFASYFSLLSGGLQLLLTIRASGVLIAPLVLFILNGLVSSDQKATLVFWRIKDALPGCRAFSVHGKKDYRVDMDRLAVLRGPLPTDPKAQNALWYKIYSAHKNDVAVQKSHKDFLLARDITSMAFLFLLLVGLPFLFLGSRPLNLIYLCFLVFEYLILVLVARNYGKRFVVNVLACESVK